MVGNACNNIFNEIFFEEDKFNIGFKSESFLEALYAHHPTIMYTTIPSRSGQLGIVTFVSIEARQCRYGL